VPSKPPQPATPYHFDPRAVGPSPPPIGFKTPSRHYVKATACGQAKRGQPMTSDWNEVDCAECLKRRPRGGGP